MQEPVGCRELLVRSGALVSIEMDEERGRYAVALKDIKEGQIILKARAYCTALFHACRKQACSSCYNFTMKKSALPFSCKACNSVWYCSLACMKDRASYHQQYECRYYKEASKIPSGSQYERWFFKLLDNVCNRGRRHVLEIYERNDVMDICRWVISYCARSLAENDLRKLEVKIDEDIPIPTHSQVLELTDNDQALPALEREQLLYLHRFLSILSSALTGKKKDIRNNAYRPGDSNSLNELPQTLSDLFVWRFSVEEFTRNINIRQSNCFGIWDEGGERLGQSLFLQHHSLTIPVLRILTRR
ncbi:hypothetical protein BC829DRAFT_432986 [Chytridium lagenaria]|nr:hypothetical protein BC829DRAFT_432986 [Chytridium lagenaria]